MQRQVDDSVAGLDHIGLDQVGLTTLPFLPELRLHLAGDAIILWARLEAEAGRVLPPPYWASAWVGGQALARYVLDHPQSVRGLRVLDLAAGCGQAGIAAALAGAASVQANDTDPYAAAAIALNASANRVAVTVSDTDLLDFDGADPDVDVVLAGDVFYRKDMAARVQRFMQRVTSRGTRVFVGDPGRAFLPSGWWQPLTTYQVPTTDGIENTEIKQTQVLRPRTHRVDLSQSKPDGSL